MDAATVEKLLVAASKFDRLESLLQRLERATRGQPTEDDDNPTAAAADAAFSSAGSGAPSRQASDDAATIDRLRSRTASDDPTLPDPSPAPAAILATAAAAVEREATLLARIARLEEQNRALQAAVLATAAAPNDVAGPSSQQQQQQQPRCASPESPRLCDGASDGLPATSLYAKRSTRSASVEIQLFEAHMAAAAGAARARASTTAIQPSTSSLTATPAAAAAAVVVAGTSIGADMSHSPVWTVASPTKLDSVPTTMLPSPALQLDTTQMDSGCPSGPLSPVRENGSSADSPPGGPTADAETAAFAAKAEATTNVATTTAGDPSPPPPSGPIRSHSLPSHLPSKASFRLLRADSRQCEYSHVGNGRISLGVRSTNLVRLNWAPKDAVHERQPTNVLIIKKPGDAEVAKALYDVALWLHAHGKTVWVEPVVQVEQLAGIDQLPFLRSWTSATQLSQLHTTIDLVVCLGGDGTLLWASGLFATSVPPVISFSLGSLGFLSPFPIDSFPAALAKVFRGGFHLTLRSRLVCTIVRAKQSSNGGTSSSSSSGGSGGVVGDGVGGGRIERKKKLVAHGSSAHGLHAGAMARGHSDSTMEEEEEAEEGVPPSSSSASSASASAGSASLPLPRSCPPSLSIVKARHYSLSAQGFNTSVASSSAPAAAAAAAAAAATGNAVSPLLVGLTHAAASTLGPPDSSAHIRSHSRLGGGQSVGVDLVDTRVDTDHDATTNDEHAAAAGDDIDSDSAPSSASSSRPPGVVHTASARAASPPPPDDVSGSLPTDDVESYVCMNEVIIERGLSSYLTLLDCFVDSMLFTRVQADAIIVGTPTGSTAYSLSAGGSMIHPEVPCVPVSDTRILTDRGFLFYDQLVGLVSAGQTVLYACYDEGAQQLVYQPGELIPAYQAAGLLEFTQRGESRNWGPDADEYGHLHQRGDDRSDHLSIRVTPNHTMFVQMGHRRTKGGPITWTKQLGGLRPPQRIPAGELLLSGPVDDVSSDDDHSDEEEEAASSAALTSDVNSHVRFLAYAAAGVGAAGELQVVSMLQRELGLQPDQVNAFLEVFGFWLGDGGTDLSRERITFGQTKQSDRAWLHSILPTLLRPLEWSADKIKVGDRERFYTSAPLWWRFFHRHCGVRFLYPNQKAGGSEEHESPASSSAADDAAPSDWEQVVAELDESDSDASDVDEGDDLQSTPAAVPLSSTSSAPLGGAAIPADVDPNIISSVKWFPPWVYSCSKDQLRAIVRGLRRADGVSHNGKEAKAVLYTPGILFRDALVHILLRAGYSAYFQLGARAGSVCAYREGTGSLLIRPDVYEQLSGEEQAGVTARHDQWAVHWTDPTSGGPATLASGHPHMARSTIRQVAGEKVWCVQVAHQDNLVVMQRAARGVDGRVTKASRPVVIGNCMLFTPVCPHSLSFRPLLFPDTSTLQIKVSLESRGPNCASFDGRHRVVLNPGDSLLISMSRWPLPSICRLDGTTDWFDGVRSVLQWNSRSASQKAFGPTTAATTNAHANAKRQGHQHAATATTNDGGHQSAAAAPTAALRVDAAGMGHSLDSVAAAGQCHSAPPPTDSALPVRAHSDVSRS